MRNAVRIDESTVVTMDNSGCIGEKELDAVHVPNELAAYYTARVALLEQWCAGAEPTQLFLANFTGDEAWSAYEKGIQEAFTDIGVPMPELKGSTESNFKSLQSGISLMMIGKVQYEITKENLHWFVVGKPLVGEEVIVQSQHVAKLNEIHNIIRLDIAKQVWPVGSKGILLELQRIFPGAEFECSIDMEKTSGPATAVIVGVPEEELNDFKSQITTIIEPIKILF
ncbi:MAG TPA: hypothetical protein VNS08_14600 [Ureibacillus sp.]|nr:hypothetical protein [Ureibacillus sp.]